MSQATIGQIAKMAGVNIDTIRYYEKRGLLPAPARRPSGYRQYSQDAIRRIRFIRHAKALGFTLHEIAELLSLRADPHTCTEVKKRADVKVEEIKQRISALQKMSKVLSALSRKCDTPSESSECPILEALDAEVESLD